MTSDDDLAQAHDDDASPVRPRPPMSPRFEDELVERDLFYAIGVEADSGVPFLSIPVSMGIADWEENYELTPEQYERFLADRAAAAAYADECRRREHEPSARPGWNLLDWRHLRA